MRKSYVYFSLALLFMVLSVVAAAAQEEPFSHPYVGRRTVMLPFRHLQSRLGSLERVNNRIETLLKNQGLLVVNRDRVTKAIWKVGFDPRTTDLTLDQIRYFGQHFNADLVVSGEIIDYRFQKKFRPANMLLFPPGLGYILYGSVAISTKIYKVASGDEVFSHAVNWKGKNQIGGLFQHPNSVMDRILNRAALDLYRDFFYPVEETYHPNMK